MRGEDHQKIGQQQLLHMQHALLSIAVLSTTVGCTALMKHCCCRICKHPGCQNHKATAAPTLQVLS
jgi:hypothetical protein